MRHAMQGYPIQMGHGEEFWQNVVHWRRGWQTTSVFLPRKPHEQYEKTKKNMTLKDKLPRSGGVQQATVEEQRSNSKKNEEAGRKWKCS